MRDLEIRPVAIMIHEVLPPDSAKLTLICGLGRSDVTRYYLSHRQPGLWEFWEQRPDSGHARLVFGRRDQGNRSEVEVAKRLLADFLGSFDTAILSEAETVGGLLSIGEIRRILAGDRRRAEAGSPRVSIDPSRSDPSAA